MAKVTLGEVAVECRESCRGDKSGLPAVGLEHLTPEQIRLSSWAVNTENTFTKLFRRDDMLFGRRRAYLKKAAQAPFDGICSGDITVIRARPGKLLPELLPFIIQNDDLFDFAVGRSDGSLSPRVKWENLANYTFELPPLAEQKKLAEVLWSISDTIQAYQDLLTKTEELVQARFVEMFGDPATNPKGWTTKRLLSMGDCKNGMNFHAGDTGMKIHCLGVGDFKNLSVIDGTEHLPVISLNEAPSEESLLRDGDIVFVRSNGNKALVGRCLVVYPRSTPTTYSGFCIRYRLTSGEVDSAYLLWVLKMDSMRKKMAGRGANIQNLSQQVLAALDIPLPPIEFQKQFVAFVNQADQSKSALQRTITSLQETKRSLAAEALCMGRKE